MLAIRMQRTGRKGHSQFRVVVQDSQFSPSSGRVVAYLGSYNPHSKTTTLDKQKAAIYLKNGAKPSERVVKLLKNEGVDLPDWVTKTEPKSRAIRNQDKLRRNRPAEEVTPEETPTTETEEVEAAPEVENTEDSSDDHEDAVNETNPETTDPELETPSEPKDPEVKS